MVFVEMFIQISGVPFQILGFLSLPLWTLRRILKCMIYSYIFFFFFFFSSWLMDTHYCKCIRFLLLDTLPSTYIEEEANTIFLKISTVSLDQ